MSAPVSLLVVGAGGRMGRAILELAAEDPAVRVLASLVRRPPSIPLPGAPPWFVSLEEASAAVPGAVAIDLSVPAGAAERIRTLAERGHPLVEGTTGLTVDAEDALRGAAQRVAVVRASNLSPGMALLRRALRAVLGGSSLEWEIGIEERHHRGKQDAPSGTALLLAAEIEGLRPSGAMPVPITSLREGEVVGEHSVHLVAPEEEIVLTHRARSRRLFARGALLAARFAGEARPGLYGIDDVLA